MTRILIRRYWIAHLIILQIKYVTPHINAIAKIATTTLDIVETKSASIGAAQHRISTIEIYIPIRVFPPDLFPEIKWHEYKIPTRNVAIPNADPNRPFQANLLTKPKSDKLKILGTMAPTIKVRRIACIDFFTFFKS